MEEENWEETKKRIECLKEKLEAAEREARREIKPAAPKRKSVNPWWYVLAGWQVVVFFFSIFVYHYLFISPIIRLCLVVMRIKGKITTVYFWPLFLVGGLVIDIIELYIFFRFFPPTPTISFTLADVFLFWLFWQASSCSY